jgi:hypothetical protein
MAGPDRENRKGAPDFFLDPFAVIYPWLDQRTKTDAIASPPQHCSQRPDLVAIVQRIGDVDIVQLGLLPGADPHRRCPQQRIGITVSIASAAPF